MLALQLQNDYSAPMTKTLALNEKVILDSSVSLASVIADMQAGRIKHDPATKAGQVVMAGLGYDEDGKVTLASVKRGDMDGSGGFNADDFNQRMTMKIALGMDGDYALLDENAYIANALAP